MNDLNDLRGAAARESAGAGCLLGLAVGDALGLPYEGLSRRRQHRWFATIDRHRLLGRCGLCSDDTEHAWMTAQALLASGGDPQRFAQSLAWKLRGWLLGLPAGIGFATLRACVRLWLGIPPARSGVDSAGNGATMRATIIGVALGDAPATLRSFVDASTRQTHRNPDAADAALAIACAAHVSATCSPDMQSVRYLERIARELGAASNLHIALSDAVASVERGESSAQFAVRIGCGDGVSGYVMHTVPVVVHAWLSAPNDFRHAVTTVIRLGGDTDTTAALVGGIVGARVGACGIPAEWIDGVVEWPRTTAKMRQLGARAVHALRSRQTPIDVSLCGIALRNAAFLSIVLVHGLRRLLPPYL